MPSGVYARTDETRRKISKAQRGENNSFYGKCHSEESKRKTSESLKGKKRKPLTKEHKKKLSESHKGIKPSEETRIKMSESHRGKKLSKLHRKNISIAKKGKNNPSWKGGKFTNKLGYVLIYKPTHPFANRNNYVYEHRLIMEKHSGRYLKREEIVHHIDGDKANNTKENLKLFPNWRECAKQCMLNGGAIKALIGIKNPSKPQVELFNFVKKFYPEAKLNFPIKIRKDKGYSLDIAVPELKVNFEYDGNYWHNGKEIQDFFRDEDLIERGWCVVRIKGEKELEEILN